MYTISVTCKCGTTTVFKTTDNVTSCDCDGCLRSFAVQVWN